MTPDEGVEFIRWVMFFNGLLSIAILYLLWKYRRHFGVLL